MQQEQVLLLVEYALETVLWSYHCICIPCKEVQQQTGQAKQTAGARLKGQSAMDTTCESNPINVVGTSHNGPRVGVEGSRRVWGTLQLDL